MSNAPHKVCPVSSRGYATLYILVFAAIFIMLIFGLLGVMFTQNKVIIAKENKSKALQISEAGLEYYRWLLAHFSDELQDRTGGPGPYEHEYSDPEGGAIGKFSLEISGNQKCNILTSIDINSTGWTYAKPEYTKETYGRYARPSVANYAYILNSNVWAGSDRVIKGRYHSNGGIRMDGENQSLVTSAVSNWWCTSSFGCSPSQTQDGVFGGGSGSVLWSFPVEPVDFVGITQDLLDMKTQAQTGGGVYFQPAGGQSNRRGYHAIFKSDGTFDMYKVTNTTRVWGYDSSVGWKREYNIIASETPIGNYDIPASCSLIFVEDKLWIEGVVKGKVTIAAAKVSQPNFDADIILSGDIMYTTADGSDGLTAVAENSVLIPLNSPDDMEIRGILVAQKGHFGRNHYDEDYLPSSLDPYVRRNSLNMIGSIVSNGRVGTKWSCGGNYCSGYASRQNSYDRKLATDPPPLTPFVDDEYEFIEWREEK
ncbi:MAG: hypothetical protein BMS9Abin13_300 [Patescibacteria group bacterium]|nr:MAG: hypothetical protein BMS9Abin13_300 [Patescibacteria group bacterium]